MVSFFLSAAKCIVDYMLCAWVFSWFFNYRTVSKVYTIIVILVASLGLAFINTFHISWVNTLAAMIGSFAIAAVLFVAPWQSKLISSIAVIVILVMSEFIPVLARATITNSNVAGLVELTIRDAGFNLMSTGVFYTILMGAKIVLLNRFNGNDDIGVNNNGWSVLFPIISIIFVYYILYVDATYADTSQNTYVYGILYLLILIANVGFFFGETSADKRYKIQAQLNELRFQQSKADAIIQIKDQHLQEMQELIHDFNGQINGLKQLFIDGDIGQDVALEYIEQMRENVQEANRFIFVDSKPLQLILNQTNEKCLRCGIDFIVDIRYASFQFMSYPDVFSLFENALENALNACMSLPENQRGRIVIQILKPNNQIVINISNTYSKNEATRKVYVAKRGLQKHGFGILNIKKIVKKYGGTIHIDDSQEFRLMISIPYDWSVVQHTATANER